jgi:hypothetical protein
MKKHLRLKDLIKILEKYDENLPVVITREGKGDQYGILKTDIKIIKHAYFGNDDADESFPNDEDFLNIGSC